VVADKGKTSNTVDTSSRFAFIILFILTRVEIRSLPNPSVILALRDPDVFRTTRKD
jgi:hypothetical protein